MDCPFQAFDISFSYIDGDKNVLADALSQNSLNYDDLDLDDAEFTMCFLLKHASADATAKDPLLSRVVTAIDHSWSLSGDRQLPLLYSMRDQLSVKRCSLTDGTEFVLKSD